MTTLPPTVILPPELDAHILAELLALWIQFAPRDAYERLIVTRIIQATARLHLSALRETDEVDPVWLRYESAADRLFRQSLKALEKHRAQHPITAPTPAATPMPTPIIAEPRPRPQTHAAPPHHSPSPQPPHSSNTSSTPPRSTPQPHPTHNHAPPTRGAA